LHLDHKSIIEFSKKKEVTIKEILKHFELDQKDYFNVHKILHKNKINYLREPSTGGRPCYSLSPEAIEWCKANKPTVTELSRHLNNVVSYATLKVAMKRAGIKSRKDLIV
jgi:hypothetical protein